MVRALVCLLALVPAAFAQAPQLTLRKGVSGDRALIRVGGLQPLADVSLYLTQTTGALTAPVLRASRLTGRTDRSGRALWVMPSSKVSSPGTAFWAQVQGPQTSGSSWSGLGGMLTPSGVGPLPLFLDEPDRLPGSGAGLYGASVTSGDIDADGLDDLLFSGSVGVLLWCQTPQGTFVDETAIRLPGVGAHGGWCELVDLDGDGLPEVFLGGADPLTGIGDRILWNDGSGIYGSPLYLPLGPCRSSGVAAGDVDGDLEIDIVRTMGAAGHGTKGGADELLLGDGAGQFLPDAAFSAAAWNETVTASTSVVMADLDGDTDLDLFIGKADPGAASGTFGAQNILLINDGGGSFLDVSSSQLLPVWCKDQSYDIQVADLEGDGDLDLVLANGLTSVPGAQSADLLVNQGGAQGGIEGVFVDAAGALPESPPIYEAIRLAVAWADFDLDGLADVCFGVHDLPPGAGGQPLFMGVSAAPPAFSRLQAFQTGTFIVGGLVTLDVDGDGDLDLFMTAAGSAGGGSDATRGRVYVNHTF